MKNPNQQKSKIQGKSEILPAQNLKILLFEHTISPKRNSMLKKYVKHFCDVFDKGDEFTYTDLQQALVISHPTRMKVIKELLRLNYIAMTSSILKQRKFKVIK